MERKLFEIPLPDDFHQHVSIGSSLWAFGEFFSLWTTDYDNSTVEVWVMKESKLNLSWTKTHVLPLDVKPLTLEVYNDFYFKPICSTNNGDIIGTIPGSRLVKYNDKGQRLGHHSFCNSPSDIVMYTESLISLPGDNEQFIN
ncbi:F-box family protein [Trifolium medium]|uniref:F-box family protein n=1 Tax=Trifolium medium TaxID=97028 RepID=A0A392MXD2_9FABA|nr:F-box family protein [Trifolium medium]